MPSIERWMARSQIRGLQSGPTCDPSEHAGANLLAIVEGEDVVWKTFARQGLVRTGLALDLPTGSKQGSQYAPRLGGWPRAHRAELGGEERDAHEIRASFRVLQAISEHSQGQRLGTGDR